MFTAFERLVGPDPWSDLAKTLTSVGIWLGTAAVIGVTRALRRGVT